MNEIKKNEKYIVDIIDYGANGEGIAKINGFTIFVNGALKGEQCEILILKVNKNYAYAKVTELIKRSSERCEPDCKTFPRCGGCSLRHIDYKETLKIKRQKVQNLIDKTFGKDNSIIINQTIGMESPYNYRNKAIYPITIEKKPGIFASRSHNIVPFAECKIQTTLSQEISKYVCDNWKGTIYNEVTNKGCLRNIMVREAFATKEVMLVLVENEYDENALDITKLINVFPMIKTVIINNNNKVTNVVLSRENKVLYGSGYITDILGGKRFKISANSFYQVNPKQTETIYNLAISKAELKKDDVLCDLYCGIGTIGIFSSDKVKQVYGIEIVDEAIADANENAKINQIDNIQFIVGDVKTAFSKLLKMGIKPNTTIVDPPRKGLDEETIKNLNELELETLVYVSCSPETLTRDLKELSKTYRIKEITPIDNFPYTRTRRMRCNTKTKKIIMCKK